MTYEEFFKTQSGAIIECNKIQKFTQNLSILFLIDKIHQRIRANGKPTCNTCF